MDTKTAVYSAGGKGTRLRPYTTSFPKPLMPVGDRPVLEILIEQLIRDGFTHFHFAVGHLAELIEATLAMAIGGERASRFRIHVKSRLSALPVRWLCSRSRCRSNSWL